MVKTRVFYALSTVDIMLCTTLIAFLDKQLFFLASGFHRMQGSLCCQITSRFIQPGQVLPTGLYLTSRLSVLTGLGILLIHLFWLWLFCRRWWKNNSFKNSFTNQFELGPNGLSLSSPSPPGFVWIWCDENYIVYLIHGNVKLWNWMYSLQSSLIKPCISLSDV